MVELFLRSLEQVTSQWNEEVNKVFLQQLGEVSREQTLVLVQDFNVLHIYRRGSNPRRLVRSSGNDF